MANPWAPLSIQPPTKSSCQKSLAPRFVCMVCLEALGTLGDNIQQKKGKNKKLWFPEEYNLEIMGFLLLC